MEKLNYISAEIEIIKFDESDILTTSNPFEGDWDAISESEKTNG